MNCQQAIQAMQATLDADRAGPLPAAAREHLEACSDCRRAWAEAQSLEASLGEAASKDVPLPSPDFHPRLMTAIRQEQRRLARTGRARSPLPPRRVLAAAAALTIILSAGVFVNRPPRLDSTPSAPTRPAPPQATPAAGPSAFDIDLTQWLGNPKQDLTELANQILETTRGVIDVESLKQPPHAIAAEATPRY